MVNFVAAVNLLAMVVQNKGWAVEELCVYYLVVYTFLKLVMHSYFTNKWFVMCTGNSIMARPVTEPGVKLVPVYFPGTDEIWYDLDTFQPFHSSFFNIPVDIHKVRIWLCQSK